jgi:hypothetical protein
LAPYLKGAFSQDCNELKEPIFGLVKVGERPRIVLTQHLLLQSFNFFQISSVLQKVTRCMLMGHILTNVLREACDNISIMQLFAKYKLASL